MFLKFSSKMIFKNPGQLNTWVASWFVHVGCEKYQATNKRENKLIMNTSTLQTSKASGFYRYNQTRRKWQTRHT